jgi:hypothetical protein
MKISIPDTLTFNGGYVDTAGFLALQGLFTARVRSVPQRGQCLRYCDRDDPCGGNGCPECHSPRVFSQVAADHIDDRKHNSDHDGYW